MKKFLSLLLALTLVVGMLSAFTVSAAVNTTVFYNALTNEAITSLDGVESIYATTTFTGRYEDNASVIVSHYAANGKLTKVESIVPVDSKIGESVTYTTPEISVADTDIIKIFAWTGVDTIKPLLKFPGVISRNDDIALPTATVTELDVATITDVPLTFAMNFKADPATQAQLLAYGNWYADFELKVNKDVTFNLDGTADGYLAGQYDSWSPAWVQVPKKAVTLAANTPLKIMETGAQTYGKPGLKYTYGEVYDRVKDFDCGVFFTDEFLAANPDIYVTLELRMYNPLNEAESYLIGETYEFGKIPAKDPVLNTGAEIEAAVTEATNSALDGEGFYVLGSHTKAASFTVKLNVPEDGTYKFASRFLTSHGYAMTSTPIQVSIPDADYSAAYATSGFSLTDWNYTDGTFNLTAGEHEITISAAADTFGNTLFNGIKLEKATAGETPEPTPEPTEEPDAPEWVYAAQNQTGYFNGYKGGTEPNANLAPGQFVKITVPGLTYTGVYSFQLYLDSIVGGSTANVRVLTADGYYADYELTQAGIWTNRMEPGKDMPLYLNEGDNTVYIINIGTESTFYVGDTDCGRLDAAGVDATLDFMDMVQTGGEIPTEPEPTPTPDVPVGDAPSELTGTDFVAAMTNTSNMVANGDNAEFGYGQTASFTVTLGVEAEGDYQLAALFGSNATYVMNSEVTKVAVDGVEVTSFPQTNKIYPTWSGASDNIHLTEGNHTFTLTTKSSWNRLYIYGLRLESVTTEATVLTAQNVVAEVPAGVAIGDGSTPLALTLTDLESSQSGIEANANQTLDSMDVHIAGVSSANTTPILVTINEAAPAGLNKGNLSLYHVDNGETVKMVEVDSKEDLVEANQFTYDPADGTVTLAMTSFSEIAMLSDNTKVWNGNATYDWYDKNPNADIFYIANADQMVGFGKLVGGMRSGAYVEADRVDFAGKTVVLLSDLNFGGAAVAEPNGNVGLVYYPVGYYNEKDGDSVTYSNFKSFKGDFDGNGNTIANIYQTTWIMEGDYHDGYPAGTNYYKDGMGVFGYVVDGTVKNLTVKNLSTVGEFTPTGCVAAYAGGNATFENITLENCNPQVYNTGNGGIVGINGSSTEVCNLTFRNITIDQTNKISALWGSWDVGCGGIMGMLRGNADNKVHFENCHVAAIIDVNNDVCANYQYYQYRYAGMYLGTVDYHINFNGQTRPDIQNRITAVDCTATYGDWNEYWYCELVANSLASYTHDHQFSRLTKIASVSDIQNADGSWKTTGNFIIPPADKASEGGECFHIMKKADGTLYRHFHDVADESNPNIYETKDINGDGELNDLKEDRQRYYMPFGQLFTGYGWGARAIYNETDLKDYTGIEIDIKDSGTVTSIEKFASKGVTEIAIGSTVKLGDLFDATVTDQNIVQYTLQAFVSPVGEESTVTATVSMNNANWRESTITFAGEGDAKITLNDYFYCVPTTIYVTVAEAKPVDKFVGKEVTLTHDLTTIESGIATTLGELFGTVPGAEINSATVTVTGINATVDTANWANTPVVLTGTDAYTITITDGDKCNIATTTVTLNAPNPVDKWDGKSYTIYLTLEDYGNEQTVQFSSLFTTLVDESLIKDRIITVDPATTVNQSAGEITVPGSAGTYKVTVTDKFYSNAETATINIINPNPVVKWTAKTGLNYEVDPGANVTVTLADLFTLNKGLNGEYRVGTVTYTVGKNSYNVNAANWKTTKVVLGTGTHTITIKDDLFCSPATGYTATVTVSEKPPVNKFTALNPSVTHTLASIDAKAVSVKLGDIFSGTNVVTGNITVTIAGTTTTVKDSNWANATVTIPGTTGDVAVTINDNNNCVTATGKVTLKAPANVTKFTKVADKTYTYTLDNVGGNVTYKVSDLFAGVSGAYIKTANVTVTGTGVTHTANATWTNGTITVKGAGKYTVTITDGFYCNGTTATITVKDPGTVNKWSAKSNLAFEFEEGTAKTVTLGQLFNVTNDKLGTVQYTVNGGSKQNVSGDWKAQSITLTTGDNTITITDTLFANTATASFKVTEKAIFGWSGVETHPDANGAIEPIKGISSNMTVGTTAKTITVNAPAAGVYLVNVKAGASSAATLKLLNETEHKAEFSLAAGSSVNNWALTGNNYKYILLIKGQNNISVSATATVTLAAVDFVALQGQGIGGANGEFTDYRNQVAYDPFVRFAHDCTDMATITLQPQKSMNYTVNLPSAGYYGLRIQGAGTKSVLRIETDTGFYGDMKDNVSGWNAQNYYSPEGYYQVIYARAGSQTIKLTNVGNSAFTIGVARLYGVTTKNEFNNNSDAYMQQHFNFTIESSIKNEDIGDGSGTVTPTPTPTPTPVGPTKPTPDPSMPTWGFNVKLQTPHFNGYVGEQYATTSNTAITIPAGEHRVFTTQALDYDGVYGLQLRVQGKTTTTVRVITETGYWAEYNINGGDCWTNGSSINPDGLQDQALYLKGTTNKLCIKNTGDQPISILKFDYGRLNGDGKNGNTYISLVGIGETFLP